jgi:Escherichia/Staphylococcus phage prohead protease
MTATMTRRKNTKQLRIAIKQVNEDGTFEGQLAVYNNVDLGKDLIEPGAFTKTIQEHGSEVPLLWQHYVDEPIGTLQLVDGPDALSVKGKLLLDLPTAKKAYLLLKAKVIKGLSIGYDTIKDSIDSGVRHLKELRLWEGSIVTFPMNELAIVTDVKGLKRATKAEDFNTELAEIQLSDMHYQMMSALYSSLSQLTWSSDLSKEDKIATCQTICEQFSAAYMEFYPVYLEYLEQEYGGMEYMSRRQIMQQKAAQMLSRTFPETKEGRKFSSDTLETLQGAHGHVKEMMDHCKSLDDTFTALFSDEAADDTDAEAENEDEGEDKGTSKRKAATREPEPVANHSAANALVDNILALVKSA